MKMVIGWSIDAERDMSSLTSCRLGCLMYLRIWGWLLQINESWTGNMHRIFVLWVGDIYQGRVSAECMMDEFISFIMSSSGRVYMFLPPTWTSFIFPVSCISAFQVVNTYILDFSLKKNAFIYYCLSTFALCTCAGYTKSSRKIPKQSTSKKARSMRYSSTMHTDISSSHRRRNEDPTWWICSSIYSWFEYHECVRVYLFCVYRKPFLISWYIFREDWN